MIKELIHDPILISMKSEKAISKNLSGKDERCRDIMGIHPITDSF